MQTLSTLLSKYKPNTDIGTKVSKELFFIELKKKLEQNFKPIELEQIKPIYIKNNKLKIYCKNPIVTSIFKLKKTEILEQANSITPNIQIESILFEINENF